MHRTTAHLSCALVALALHTAPVMAQLRGDARVEARIAKQMSAVERRGPLEIGLRTEQEKVRLERRIDHRSILKRCGSVGTDVLHVPKAYIDIPLRRADYADGSFEAHLVMAFRWRGGWRKPEPLISSLTYDDDGCLVGDTHWGFTYPMCFSAAFLKLEDEALLQLSNSGAESIMDVSLRSGSVFMYRKSGVWWVLDSKGEGLIQQPLSQYIEENWEVMEERRRRLQQP